MHIHISGPADPPLSQHELKCFSTIFDSQQSIFLPSSSQSTSPSSSLSSSTLTLSSSSTSTSLPSSLSPAGGMVRSYSNSSLPAPHLGGSVSSESFIWGILVRARAIAAYHLISCMHGYSNDMTRAPACECTTQYGHTCFRKNKPSNIPIS